MTFPNIPDVSPAIDISRDQVINLLLASIAFEELGLAHIINAEAEKIQYILGTLDEQTPPESPTIEDLITINGSVNNTLRTVIKNQMLLQFKLEDVAQYGGVAQPAINVQTFVSVDGGLTYVNANTAPYPTLVAPTKPMYKFVVKNTGNVKLTLVSLSDTTFGPISIGGTLAPGASFEVFKTGTFEAGQNCNIATVTGAYATETGVIEVEDEDSACYIGVEPTE